MADFASWGHANLVDFAHAMNDENKKLREDMKMLHNAWRESLKERCLGAALVGSPDRGSPARLQEQARETLCASLK